MTEITLALFTEVEKVAPEFDEMQVTHLIEEVSIAVQQNDSSELEYSAELVEAVTKLIAEHDYRFELEDEGGAE